MAIQTERGQFDGSINVDGSIFQYGVEFTGGGGGGGTGDVAWASGNVGSATQLITAAGDGSIVAESEITFSGGELIINASTAITQRSEFNNISLGNTRRSDIQIKAGAEAIYFGVDPCITGFDTITSYIDNRTGGPFALMTNGNEQLILATDGKVGFGGTPTFNAEVIGSDPALGLKNTSSGDKSWRIKLTDNDFYITESGVAERLIIFSGGNVGRGIYTASDVQVDGSVYAQDGFQTVNYAIVHNATSDTLDFNYIG
jgi:hypothetical protein